MESSRMGTRTRLDSVRFRRIRRQGQDGGRQTRPRRESEQSRERVGQLHGTEREVECGRTEEEGRVQEARRVEEGLPRGDSTWTGEKREWLAGRQVNSPPPLLDEREWLRIWSDDDGTVS